MAEDLNAMSNEQLRALIAIEREAHNNTKALLASLQRPDLTPDPQTKVTRSHVYQARENLTVIHENDNCRRKDRNVTGVEILTQLLENEKAKNAQKAKTFCKPRGSPIVDPIPTEARIRRPKLNMNGMKSVKIDGANYADWRRKLKALLEPENLWYPCVIECPDIATWTAQERVAKIARYKKDSKLATKLILKVCPKIIAYACGPFIMAKPLMDYLENRFALSDATIIDRLNEKWESWVLEPDTSVHVAMTNLVLLWMECRSNNNFKLVRNACISFLKEMVNPEFQDEHGETYRSNSAVPMYEGTILTREVMVVNGLFKPKFDKRPQNREKAGNSKDLNWDQNRRAVRGPSLVVGRGGARGRGQGGMRGRGRGMRGHIPGRSADSTNYRRNAILAENVDRNCFNCKLPGHIAISCPEFRNVNIKSTKQENKGKRGSKSSNNVHKSRVPGYERNSNLESYADSNAEGSICMLSMKSSPSCLTSEEYTHLADMAVKEILQSGGNDDLIDCIDMVKTNVAIRYKAKGNLAYELDARRMLSKHLHEFLNARIDFENFLRRDARPNQVAVLPNHLTIATAIDGMECAVKTKQRKWIKRLESINKLIRETDLKRLFLGAEWLTWQMLYTNKRMYASLVERADFVLKLIAEKSKMLPFLKTEGVPAEIHEKFRQLSECESRMYERRPLMLTMIQSSLYAESEIDLLELQNLDCNHDDGKTSYPPLCPLRTKQEHELFQKGQRVLPKVRTHLRPMVTSTILKVMEDALKYNWASLSIRGDPTALPGDLLLHEAVNLLVTGQTIPVGKWFRLIDTFLPHSSENPKYSETQLEQFLQLLKTGTEVKFDGLISTWVQDGVAGSLLTRIIKQTPPGGETQDQFVKDFLDIRTRYTRELSRQGQFLVCTKTYCQFKLFAQEGPNESGALHILDGNERNLKHIRVKTILNFESTRKVNRPDMNLQEFERLLDKEAVFFYSLDLDRSKDPKSKYSNNLEEGLNLFHAILVMANFDDFEIFEKQLVIQNPSDTETIDYTLDDLEGWDAESVNKGSLLPAPTMTITVDSIKSPILFHILREEDIDLITIAARSQQRWRQKADVDVHGECKHMMVCIARFQPNEQNPMFKKAERIVADLASGAAPYSGPNLNFNLIAALTLEKLRPSNCEGNVEETFRHVVSEVGNFMVQRNSIQPERIRSVYERVTHEIFTILDNNSPTDTDLKNLKKNVQHSVDACSDKSIGKTANSTWNSFIPIPSRGYEGELVSKEVMNKQKERQLKAQWRSGPIDGLDKACGGCHLKNFERFLDKCGCRICVKVYALTLQCAACRSLLVKERAMLQNTEQLCWALKSHTRFRATMTDCVRNEQHFNGERRKFAGIPNVNGLSSNLVIKGDGYACLNSLAGGKSKKGVLKYPRILNQKSLKSSRFYFIVVNNAMTADVNIVDKVQGNRVYVDRFIMRNIILEGKVSVDFNSKPILRMASRKRMEKQQSAVTLAEADFLDIANMFANYKGFGRDDIINDKHTKPTGIMGKHDFGAVCLAEGESRNLVEKLRTTTFIVDSGCTLMSVNHHRYIPEYSKTEQPKNLTVANGDVVIYEGAGEMNNPSRNGKAFCWNYTLCTPRLPNLISTVVMKDGSYWIDSEIVLVAVGNEKSIVLVATQDEVEFDVMRRRVLALDVEVRSNNKLLHESFSHFCVSEMILKNARLNVVEVLDIQPIHGVLKRYADCFMFEMKAKDYKSTEHIVDTPSDISHYNFNLKIQTKSSDNISYVLIAKGVLCKYYKVFEISHKGKTWKIVLKFYDIISDLTKFEVKVIIYDQEAEAICRRYLIELDRGNILKRNSPAWTLQFTGFACSAIHERKFGADSMRFMKNGRYWSAYLGNSQVQSNLTKTLFEVLHGGKSRVDYDSKAPVYFTKHKQRAGNQRDKEGFLVGFWEESDRICRFRHSYPSCISEGRKVKFQKTDQEVTELYINKLHDADDICGKTRGVNNNHLDDIVSDENLTSCEETVTVSDLKELEKGQGENRKGVSVNGAQPPIGTTRKEIQKNEKVFTEQTQYDGKKKRRASSYSNNSELIEDSEEERDDKVQGLETQGKSTEDADDDDGFGSDPLFSEEENQSLPARTKDNAEVRDEVGKSPEAEKRASDSEGEQVPGTQPSDGEFNTPDVSMREVSQEPVTFFESNDDDAVLSQQETPSKVEGQRSTGLAKRDLIDPFAEKRTLMLFSRHCFKNIRMYNCAIEVTSQSQAEATEQEALRASYPVSSTNAENCAIEGTGMRDMAIEEEIYLPENYIDVFSCPKVEYWMESIRTEYVSVSEQGVFEVLDESRTISEHDICTERCIGTVKRIVDWKTVTYKSRFLIRGGKNKTLDMASAVVNEDVYVSCYAKQIVIFVAAEEKQVEIYIKCLKGDWICMRVPNEAIKVLLGEPVKIQETEQLVFELLVYFQKTFKSLLMCQARYLNDVQNTSIVQKSNPQSTIMKERPQILTPQYGLAISEGENCNGATSKMEPGMRINHDDLAQMELVGSSLVAGLARPDLAYIYSLYCRGVAKLRVDRIGFLEQKARYLRNTSDSGIFYSNETEFGKDLVIKAWCDADWGKEVDGSLTLEILITMNGQPIVRSSRKQSLVAKTSCAAGWSACDDTFRVLRKILQLMQELEYGHERPIEVKVDNSGAEQLAEGSNKRRFRYFLISYCFIKHEAKKGTDTVEYVTIDLRRADILTKSLSIQKFCEMRIKLRMCRLVNGKPVSPEPPSRKGTLKEKQVSIEVAGEKLLLIGGKKDTVSVFKTLIESNKDRRKERNEQFETGEMGNLNVDSSVFLSLILLASLQITSAVKTSAVHFTDTIGQAFAWQLSRNQVDEGYIDMSVKINVMDKCGALDLNVLLWKSKNATMESCYYNRQKEAVHSLNFLCPQRKTDLLKQKKQGKWAGEIIAYVAVAILSAMIENSVLSWVNDDDKRPKNSDLSGLKEIFKRTEVESQITEKFLRRLVNETERISRELTKQEDDLPEAKRKLVSYLTSYCFIVLKTAEAGENVHQAIPKHRNSRIDSGLLEVLGIQDAVLLTGTIRPESGQFSECFQDEKTGEQEMRMIIPKVNHDIVILKAQALKLFFEKNNDICWTKYKGPSMIGHDLSRECYYDLSGKKNDRRIFSTTLQGCNGDMRFANPINLELYSCEPTAKFNVHDTISVVPSGNSVLVYCRWNNVTVRRLTKRCGEKVHNFDSENTFEINGKQYRGEKLISNLISKVNMQLVDLYIWTPTKLFDTKHLEDAYDMFQTDKNNIGKVLFVNDQKQTSGYEWLSWMCIILGIITLCLLVYKLYRNKQVMRSVCRSMSRDTRVADMEMYVRSAELERINPESHEHDNAELAVVKPRSNNVCKQVADNANAISIENLLDAVNTLQVKQEEVIGSLSNVERSMKEEREAKPGSSMDTKPRMTKDVAVGRTVSAEQLKDAEIRIKYLNSQMQP